MNNQHSFEVIIIGGSYAGLSAAMALGRSLRHTLIIDSGLPCNRQTPHSHNFLTHDGDTPAAIAQQAREEIAGYSTITFRNDLVTAGKKIEGGFQIETQSGERFTAKKLIFATGIRDLLPDIDGLAECWGISVIHCPYCHGYEFKGKKTGILANGDQAVHLASLINNLTDSISLLTNGEAHLSAEQQEKLDKHQIAVIEQEVIAIEHTDGRVSGVEFKGGEKHVFDAVYAAVPFEQHCPIPEEMGCELTEQGYLQVDALFKTTIPGIYACGDNASRMRSVANAVANGNFAGALVNMELTQESF